MEIASAIRARLEAAGAVERQSRLSRRGEIGRTTKQPFNARADLVQDFSRRVARCDAFGVGFELRQVAVPALGERAIRHHAHLRRESRMGALVALQRFIPVRAKRLSARAEGLIEAGAHTFGHQKLRVRQPICRRPW